MKFNVIGVKRIEGNAKATGNPFDMCRVYCMVPIQVSQGKVKSTGYGLEVAELVLLQDAMPQFAKLQFPAELELKVDQRFEFGEFRSVVTGIENAAASKLRSA